MNLFFSIKNGKKIMILIYLSSNNTNHTQTLNLIDEYINNKITEEEVLLSITTTKGFSDADIISYLSLINQAKEMKEKIKQKEKNTNLFIFTIVSIISDITFLDGFLNEVNPESKEVGEDIYSKYLDEETQEIISLFENLKDLFYAFCNFSQIQKSVIFFNSIDSFDKNFRSLIDNSVDDKTKRNTLNKAVEILVDEMREKNTLKFSKTLQFFYLHKDSLYKELESFIVTIKEILKPLMEKISPNELPIYDEKTIEETFVNNITTEELCFIYEELIKNRQSADIFLDKLKKTVGMFNFLSGTTVNNLVDNNFISNIGINCNENLIKCIANILEYIDIQQTLKKISLKNEKQASKNQEDRKKEEIIAEQLEDKMKNLEKTIEKFTEQKEQAKDTIHSDKKNYK